MAIPTKALDDRLAFLGTAGSGKTYAAGTAVERLLADKARVIIVDPLGVWHGLRLTADGKSPAFPIVIFGGDHADLPLTEAAGKLIGETAATMAESCIVDLSLLGTKAGERRFMLPFLTALYSKVENELLHVVFDEADMWAPQNVAGDKEGEAPKLLGMMETLVRRGRRKGFIPWLISQRPAVLNKNVLSQADGLVALKLTSSQDRDALDDWIAGQADKAEGKRLYSAMPTLQRGQAILWIPGRGILETVQFPRKATFDSSRTPERGEKRRTLTLKPLDLGALRDRLSKVEAETKANDPKTLKARIAELERAAKATPVAAPTISPAELAAMKDTAHAEGFTAGRAQGFREGVESARAALANLELPAAPVAQRRVAPAPAPRVAAPTVRQAAPIRKEPAGNSESGITGPEKRVIASLMFWREHGFEQPTRTQVATMARYSVKTSGYLKALSLARSAGLIDFPASNTVCLTADGSNVEVDVPTSRPLDTLRPIIGPSYARVVDSLIALDGEATVSDLAAQADYSDKTSGYLKALSVLKGIGVIKKAGDMISIEPWVWQ